MLTRCSASLRRSLRHVVGLTSRSFACFASEEELLSELGREPEQHSDEKIELEEVMSVLKKKYDYKPDVFTNGAVTNAESENQASGFLLAWAISHELSMDQVLRCYGRHFRDLDPKGTDHANIREILRHEMAPGSVLFANPNALTPGIERLQTADARMSGAVIWNGVVHLSGQVPADFDADLRTQVEQTLEKIDDLLAQSGTSKSRILTAQLWLRDMSDFAEMNEIWIDWLDPANKPVRACVEAPMAHPDILFEAMVTAAASP